MNIRDCRLNLEAIFRSIKDAIITVDEECSVLELNQAAKNICHYSQRDIGQDFRTLSEGRGGKCVEAIVKTIEKRKPIELYRLECKCQHRLGQVVTLTTAPLLDEQDAFAGAVLVIRDETRLATLERALEDRRRFHNIIGENDKMQKIYSLIEELADVPTTALIRGESGTGKELVAEALHHRGSRRDKPLVKVNCAALPDNLLETELFGHVKGAFTGAISDKIGRFQRADGGTIFLDEIGDISPMMQLRLLRVLQEKEFERVGDTAPIKVDVRVVAATNQDLLEQVVAPGHGATAALEGREHGQRVPVDVIGDLEPHEIAGDQCRAEFIGVHAGPHRVAPRLERNQYSGVAHFPTQTLQRQPDSRGVMGKIVIHAHIMHPGDDFEPSLDASEVRQGRHRRPPPRPRLREDDGQAPRPGPPTRPPARGPRPAPAVAPHHPLRSQ